MRVAYEIEKTGFATEADTSTKSLVCIRCRSRLLQHPRWSAFVITVNDWKLLTIITKHSILDVAAALDPPLCIMSIVVCEFLGTTSFTGRSNVF